MTETVTCAHPDCRKAITEQSGREPTYYCGEAFCAPRCAERWAHAQLPKALEEVQRLEHCRSGLRSILLNCRSSIAKRTAVDALKAAKAS